MIFRKIAYQKYQKSTKKMICRKKGFWAGKWDFAASCPRNARKITAN